MRHFQLINNKKLYNLRDSIYEAGYLDEAELLNFCDNFTLNPCSAEERKIATAKEFTLPITTEIKFKTYHIILTDRPKPPGIKNCSYSTLKYEVFMMKVWKHTIKWKHCIKLQNVQLLSNRPDSRKQENKNLIS